MFVPEDKVLEIIEAYAIATPDGNDPGTLREWMEKYPEHAQDLMEFAASRDLLKHSVPDDSETAEERERFLERSRKTFYSFVSATAAPLIGIVATAEKLEIKKKELVTKLGISGQILTLLEERAIEFSSIPSAFIKRIAETLQSSTESVAAFLNQSMQPGEAFHKNHERPSEMVKVDFASVVENDLNLTEEQKKSLLS